LERTDVEQKMSIRFLNWMTNVCGCWVNLVLFTMFTYHR
jgi:hypothetical protein